jgi:hypothetical protein
MDDRLFEGEWKFKGYYPDECRQLPDCYVNRLAFQLDKTKDRGNYMCFDTWAERTGDKCKR